MRLPPAILLFVFVHLLHFDPSRSQVNTPLNILRRFWAPQNQASSSQASSSQGPPSPEIWRPPTPANSEIIGSVAVTMKDGFVFDGSLFQVNKDPYWMEPRDVTHVKYPGYAVLFHMQSHKLYASNLLLPRTEITPGRDPAKNLPISVVAKVHNLFYVSNKDLKFFELYRKHSSGIDRFFMTVQGTNMIYHSKLRSMRNKDLKKIQARDELKERHIHGNI